MAAAETSPSLPYSSVAVVEAAVRTAVASAQGAPVAVLFDSLHGLFEDEGVAATLRMLQRLRGSGRPGDARLLSPVVFQCAQGLVSSMQLKALEAMCNVVMRVESLGLEVAAHAGPAALRTARGIIALREINAVVRALLCRRSVVVAGCCCCCCCRLVGSLLN